MQKVVHLCCGYPSYLDQTDYLKADPRSYQMTAEKLDEAGFDQSEFLGNIMVMSLGEPLEKQLACHPSVPLFEKFWISTGSSGQGS